MDTQYWKIAGGHEFNSGAGAEFSPADEAALQEAAQLLSSGETVAFPTETVYGLGADARSTQAVERIFTAKGRPSDNPLIVHISAIDELADLVTSISPLAERLMERFWPGPLTLVLPVREGAVSPRVTAGLSTVAVRMPGHPLALRLIAAAGCPLAAPSANRSGRPSPTTAAHVRDDLAGLIGGIVDGGPTGVGLESTVVEVDSNGSRLTLLRPGGITLGQLQEAADGAEVAVDPTLLAAGEAAPAAPRSPGMKYRHYAPKGQMQLVIAADPADFGRTAAAVQAELDAAKARGETTGMLAFAEHADLFRADLVIPCGSLSRLEQAAQELYAALRRFDEQGITYILAESCPDDGIGFALMNRLNKAAGGRQLVLG